MPPPLAITDVRYVGDPVALVIAETRYLAEDACELIEVDYDPQTAVVDYTTAAADTEHLVHAGWGLESNAMVQVPFTPLSADLDEVFASRRARRRVRRRAEPLRGHADGDAAASWRRSTRAARSSRSRARRSRCTRPRTSSPATCRSPRATCTVTARDVGGGFGQKMFVYREECAVVLASFLLGRPVKWIEDRRENLLSAGHSRNEFAHVKVAVDDDGIIQAITADHVCDVGAYAVCPAGMDPMLLPGPYKTPAARASRSRWCGPTPWARPRTAGRGCSRPRPARWPSTTSPPRSASTPPSCAGATSSPFDDLPFTSPSGNVFQEITPLETLEQALELLDYEAFRKEQAEARARGTPPRRGHLLVRRAHVDGEQHPRHRGGHGEGRDERPRRRVPRHHRARPEHRDDHGADRGRAPRRGVRRRHHRAGRLAVHAVRARHRREPHRGRRRRRGARGHGRGAREGHERRRAHDGGGARRPRDRRGRGVGARARRRSR